MNTVALLNKKYNAVKHQRTQYDRNWKLNLAFYSGRQWVVWDRSFNRVIDWVPRNNKPRMVTNIIMPIVRLYLALLTKNDPEFMVVATTPEQNDVAKAKICKQFLQFVWENNNFKSVCKKALVWAIVCGDGFVKAYYDPTGAPYELNDEVHYLGDVAIDVCSPFELFFDPFARDVDEASWVIHARVRSLDYIQMKYGARVPAESEEVFNALAYVSGRKEQDTTIPSAVVKEYWERPNDVNKNGRYIVWVGNKILVDQDNPYADICPIPFARVGCIPVPGSFYHDSIVTHLRPVQVLYNRLKSDIVDNTVKLSNPMLLVPINSLLKSPEFEPGEIIYYNPLIGGNIDQVKVEPYSAATMNMLMRVMQERDDLSGLSQVALSGSARGLRSAQAIRAMLEQDQTILSTITEEYEAMISKVMTYVLHLARRFMDVPRMIRIMGENDAREIKLFKNEDIPHNADVRVVTRSTLARSPLQEREFLFSLWDRGIIQDPRLLLRLTEYGNWSELYSDIELDIQQANRENEKMRQGQPATVEDFQNHVIHVAEHNKFRKTVDYENLPDDRKELFARHVEQHKMFIQQAQLQQGGGVDNGAKERRQ